LRGLLVDGFGDIDTGSGVKTLLDGASAEHVVAFHIVAHITILVHLQFPLIDVTFVSQAAQLGWFRLTFAETSDQHACLIEPLDV